MKGVGREMVVQGFASFALGTCETEESDYDSAPGSHYSSVEKGNGHG